MDSMNFFKSIIDRPKKEYLLESTQYSKLLQQIFETLVDVEQSQKEITLLASQALFILIFSHDTPTILSKHLTNFLQLKNSKVDFLSKSYIISNLKLFQLTLTYGYLKVNGDSSHYETQSLVQVFNLLHENCIQYTKHTYFAFKILQLWLNITLQNDFWKTNDIIIEKQLEEIIFSNWQNHLNEVAKTNSIIVFNNYLKIMENKYKGFLKFTYQRCLEDISWQNQIKYVILAEIYKVWTTTAPLDEEFLISLSMSLRNKYLRHLGTRVYMNIVKKLNQDQWEMIFPPVLKIMIDRWETENDNEALQSLCTMWIEPTITKHKQLLAILWEWNKNSGPLIKSHFRRLANELNVGDIPSFDTKMDKDYLNHARATVRLNGFAIYTYNIELIVDNEDSLISLKTFLQHNINTTSIYLREGIVKYFHKLMTNLLKLSKKEDSMISLIDWLHEFLLDNFEIGSCYQRKILSLRLYSILISFQSQFIGEKDFLIVLRLILDPAKDILKMSHNIIIHHFKKNFLSDSESQIIFDVAMKNCNSFKFCQVESGACLLKILTDLDSTNNTYMRYSKILLHKAQQQFQHIKQDILKSIVGNSPLYGILTAISNVSFSTLQNQCSNYAKDILDLLEDIVDYFISVLSSKANNTEISSSFAEMGLAINETIKNSELEEDYLYDEQNLSPAHQLVLSCIWLSLKVSCEIASKMGIIEPTRCVRLITKVLIKCRHKGAVEAAGLAIYDLTKCFAKHSPEHIDSLLKNYVENLLNDHNAPSLTRRGAGLSIMFHKIVVGDNRKNRPLLHLVMNKLLNSLNENENEECFSSTDTPLVRRLQFLQTLVSDREIQGELTFYMERISILCVHHLSSQNWTIRNASLQLFGSVVPRLTGQISYSFNHFVTHYPLLFEFVLENLKITPRVTKKEHFYQYSKIIPILVLLSKLTTGGNDFIDYSSKNFIIQVKYLLKVYLKNPIWYVRTLAAKAYVALTSYPNLKNEMQQFKNQWKFIDDYNGVHGCILVIEYLMDKLKKETQSFVEYPFSEDDWLYASQRYDSYILKSMVLKLSNHKVTFEDLFNVELKQFNPGIYQFIDTQVTLYINDFTDENHIEQILESNYMISFLQSFSRVSTFILSTVMNKLLKFINLNDKSTIVDSLIEFITKTLENNEPRFDYSYFYPIAEQLIEKTNNEEFQRSLIIYFSKDYDVLDEILTSLLETTIDSNDGTKWKLTLYLKLLYHRWNDFNENIHLKLTHCSLILLKDENPCIRETVMNFLVDSNQTFHRHEESIYQNLLYETLNRHDKSKNDRLFNLYTKLIQTSNNFDLPMPYDYDFAQDKEITKFINYCFHCLILKHSSPNDVWKTKYFIQRKMNFSSIHSFNCDTIDYLIDKKNILQLESHSLIA